MILMNFKNLIKPKKLEASPENNDRYGVFVAEPLERGFGITIGNSLRRILLSSILLYIHQVLFCILEQVL